ncbi:MAG TPA: DUF1615 domain-containing protein [Lysobacter sp.]|nr:DUF1615 domain-containing protein [Lysobacter sp.]
MTPHSLLPTRTPRVRCRWIASLLLAALLVAGCERRPTPPSPEEVRAQIVRLLPTYVTDRKGWAADTYAAFAALEIEPSPQNLCAVLAVTEQESSFNPHPPVPGLGRIALTEIERRAERLHMPKLVLKAALQLESPDGRTWEQRIAAVRTEKELSDLYEAMIGAVPLGGRLLAGANPVRTGGPMQVSIAFAEAHAGDRPYPYPVESTIRHEVFTRRGGMYFGIAHLLGYEASYDKHLYRFADFNAGWYASRNAAFQSAVSKVSGIALDLDGDLIHHGSDEPGATELAVRTLATHLDLSHGEIRRALEKSHSHRFERTALYERVFELADRQEGRRLPRALIPRIRLQSPKITRRLTTAWFAKRVDGRYQRCLAKARSATKRKRR